MDERLTSVEDEAAAGNETRGDHSAKDDSVASEAAPKGKAETEGSAAEPSEGERLMAARFTNDDTIPDTFEALQLKLARNESYARGIDGAEHTLAVNRLVLEDLPPAQRATPRELFNELDEIEDPETYRMKAEEIEQATDVLVKAFRYPEDVVRADAALPGISPRDLRPLSKFYADIAGYDGNEACEYLLRTHVEELDKMAKEGRNDQPVDISFASAAKKVYGNMGRSENAGRTPMANTCVFLMRYGIAQMFVGPGPTARPLAAGADAAALEDAEMEVVADTRVVDGGEQKSRPVSYTIRLTPKGLDWLLERRARARIRKAPFLKRIKELEEQMAEHGTNVAAPRFGLARGLAVTTAFAAVGAALAALGMPEIGAWVANEVILLAGPNGALGEGRPLVHLL